MNNKPLPPAGYKSWLSFYKDYTKSEQGKYGATFIKYTETPITHKVNDDLSYKELQWKEITIKDMKSMILDEVIDWLPNEDKWRKLFYQSQPHPDIEWEENITEWLYEYRNLLNGKTSSSNSI